MRIVRIETPRVTSGLDTHFESIYSQRVLERGCPRGGEEG